MLTIDRIRFLLESYDGGKLTKDELIISIINDVFKEIVETTASGNEYMSASSVCLAGGYPPTIKLEVDYNPFLLVAKRLRK
jgi:hypothetical protein